MGPFGFYRCALSKKQVSNNNLWDSKSERREALETEQIWRLHLISCRARVGEAISEVIYLPAKCHLSICRPDRREQIRIVGD